MGLYFVQAERLELSHLAALDPKSSVSTNSTTPASPVSYGAANISQNFNFKIIHTQKNTYSFRIFNSKPKKILCKSQKPILKKTKTDS